MHRFTLAFALALTTAGALAPAAHAGALYLSPGECVKNADNSGHCEGSFTGFREHATDPQARAMFAQMVGYSWFYAYSHNVWMSCVPNAAVQAIWPQAMALRTKFIIYWDANSTCNALYLYNDSAEARY